MMFKIRLNNYHKITSRNTTIIRMDLHHNLSTVGQIDRNYSDFEKCECNLRGREGLIKPSLRIMGRKRSVIFFRSSY